MGTLTIRNVRPAVVRSLKSAAKKNRRSMEQEVRELLEGYFGERRPTAREVDSWVRAGRR